MPFYAIQQTGTLDSCGACALTAALGEFGKINAANVTRNYAETTVWPSIQFWSSKGIMYSSPPKICRYAFKEGLIGCIVEAPTRFHKNLWKLGKVIGHKRARGLFALNFVQSLPWPFKYYFGLHKWSLSHGERAIIAVLQCNAMGQLLGNLHYLLVRQSTVAGAHKVMNPACGGDYDMPNFFTTLTGGAAWVCGTLYYRYTGLAIWLKPFL